MTAPEEILRFCCGIDIGVKNLAISFIECSTGSDGESRVISYKGRLSDSKGTIHIITRFSEGEEIQELTIGGKKLSHHDSYITILEAIPEFKYTVSAVIEMQLAMNRSEMSRLDGVAYGFLRGRYPTMEVSLNGSTIRKKFIADAIAGSDVSAILVPRGYPDTKRLSFLFVGHKFPLHYTFIQTCPESDKIDDICDSVVYASISMMKHLGTRTTTRHRKSSDY